MSKNFLYIQFVKKSLNLYKILKLILFWQHFMQISLPWFSKKNQLSPIWPIFIPFAGCKTRCIFCAQELQSGTKLKNISTILADTKKLLKQRYAEQKPPPELGFFGGTFTALGDYELKLCCDFVHEQIHAKHIIGARCSTRPDCINMNILQLLQDAGFNMVELGVQSFNDQALIQSKRGYNGQIAKEACALIHEHSLDLGVQLMPGMPGVHAEIFLQDTKTALLSGAKILRFYPCQVIKGTELASLWAEKQYTPWALDQTVTTLAQALLMANAHHAMVIRMGLAPEEGLEKAILAGPRHPALGSIVKAQALFEYISTSIKHYPIKSITLPHQCQGFFSGHKNSLIKKWQSLGISSKNTSWHHANHIDITY